MSAAQAEPLDGIEDRELAYLLDRGDLSDDEVMFVQAFMRTRNVRKAAKLMGMTDGKGATAESVAYGLRRQPRIAESIAVCTAQRMEALKVTPARIEAELSKIAFSNIGDVMEIQPDGTMYLDFRTVSREQLASLKDVQCEMVQRPGDDPDSPRDVLKIKVSQYDKLTALTRLLQLHKMIGNNDAVNEAVVDIAEAIRGGRSRVAKLKGAEE